MWFECYHTIRTTMDDVTSNVTIVLQEVHDCVLIAMM